MKTLRQEIDFRIQKHALSEVLDRLADAVKETEEAPERDELIKTIETAVLLALSFEARSFSDISPDHGK
jgi:truncated hemoglobin YjbI